jgi:osmotically-inducible protein OsmY
MESSDRRDREYHEFEASIVRRAQERLSRSPYAVLARVAGSYHRGALRLRGCLPSHYLKRVAQELVSRIEGVNDVINQVEVRVAADLGRSGAPAVGPGPGPGPVDRGRGHSPEYRLPGANPV